MYKLPTIFKNSISVLCVSSALTLGFAPLAHSQSRSPSSTSGTPNSSNASSVSLNNTRKSELDDSMDKMHNSMSIKYSTNADYDFMRSMLAHHVGAVEMAQIQLKYGQDEKALKLAQSIIKSQNKEIKLMKSWIESYEKANNIGSPQSSKPSILPAKPAQHKH